MTGVERLLSARERVRSAIANLDGAFGAMQRIWDQCAHDLIVADLDREFEGAWSAIREAVCDAVDLAALLDEGTGHGC